MLGSAVFSACGRWRYRLTRQWNSGPQVVFIGLNPSTADAMLDDPTIRRCMDFARRWGFHGLTMINAFAFRSTDPRQLLATPDPIGPQNNRIIRNTCRNAPLIIAAWGNHCPVERQTELQKLTGKPIDRRRVLLHDPIRSLGTYPVEIPLTSSLSATVNVTVQGEEA